MVVSELRLKKLNDKGSYSKVDSMKPKKCFGKSQNMQGMQKGCEGRRGKLVQIQEKVVEHGDNII